MAIVKALTQVAKTYEADVENGPGQFAIEITVARRDKPRVRLLRYRLALDLDENARQALLSETLWERGNDPDQSDLGARLEVRDAAYRVGPTVGSGTPLREQMLNFARHYDLDRFDFEDVREKLRQACKDEDWTLRSLIPL